MKISLPTTCFLVSVAATLLFAAGSLHAQSNKPPVIRIDPMAAQLIDSRKGYIARIPEAAKLDSAASGWSIEGRYEKRVYRISGAGVIRLTVTVRNGAIPSTAVTSGAYTYLAADSATPGGTAKIRTYYLPTRNVKIELIPAGAKMRPYLDAAESIFSSFRWKPGATSEEIETEPPTGMPEDPHVPPRSTLGGE